MAVHRLPKRFRGDPGPLFGLVRLIQSARVDIVHTHMTSGNVYGRIAARIARARRLVTTLHYVDPEALPFLPAVLQRLFFDGDFRMAGMCDRVIATSGHLRGVLVERGINERKLVTILNGVNLDTMVSRGWRRRAGAGGARPLARDRRRSASSDDSSRSRTTSSSCVPRARSSTVARARAS